MIITRKPRTNVQLTKIDAYANARFWAAIARGDLLFASFWRQIKSRVYADRTASMR